MTTVARRTELSMLRYHGTRRYGSEEAAPIEWIVPPSRRMSSLGDQGLAEMFAYHAVTVGRHTAAAAGIPHGMCLESWWSWWWCPSACA
jgi:hypothetical protein